jgi:hypothetical protein
MLAGFFGHFTRKPLANVVWDWGQIFGNGQIIRVFGWRFFRLPVNLGVNRGKGAVRGDILKSATTSFLTKKLSGLNDGHFGTDFAEHADSGEPLPAMLF